MYTNAKIRTYPEGIYLLKVNLFKVNKKKHRNDLIDMKTLKVQPCKLYNNQYITASTQTTNTEIVAFAALLIFKLLSHKVLFIKEKTIETVKK